MRNFIVTMLVLPRDIVADLRALVRRLLREIKL